MKWTVLLIIVVVIIGIIRFMIEIEKVLKEEKDYFYTLKPLSEIDKNRIVTLCA